MNSLIVFLLWIVFFHSTSCNAFVFGVQSFQSQKMLNKIDFFIFETISKNGNSHAIDKMSQIKEEERLILLPNNGPATETSSFLQHPNNDGPAQFKQLSVSNDGRAITTLSFLHLHVPFRTATHKKLLLLPVLEGSSIIMATHMTHANFLLLSIRDNPAITVDNSAITMATRTQNLLLYAQIGSAITMVTHTQNLCCFAFKTIQQLRWLLLLISSFIWLLHSFKGLWLLKSLLLTHFQFRRKHGMLKSIFKLSGWSLITFVVPILWEHIKSLHPPFPTTISSWLTYSLRRKHSVLHVFLMML